MNAVVANADTSVVKEMVDATKVGNVDRGSRSSRGSGSDDSQKQIELCDLLSEGLACRVYELKINKRELVIKKCTRNSLSKNYLSFVDICHPNIERVYKVVFMGNAPLSATYIFAEKLDITLHQHAKLVGSQNVGTYIECIASQVSSALEYIHEKLFMLHADIKTNNIMIDQKTNNVKVIDFNNAISRHHIGQVDGFEQTILSMSHVDMIRNSYNIGPKIDFWALAMTLFWYYCGYHFVIKIVADHGLFTDENRLRKNSLLRGHLANLIDMELCHLFVRKKKDETNTFLNILFEILNKAA